MAVVRFVRPRPWHVIQHSRHLSETRCQPLVSLRLWFALVRPPLAVTRCLFCLPLRRFTQVLSSRWPPPPPPCTPGFGDVIIFATLDVADDDTNTIYHRDL